LILIVHFLPCNSKLAREEIYNQRPDIKDKE
jgi:hypothetical protein